MTKRPPKKQNTMFVNDQDTALWQAVTKTVTPLAGSRPKANLPKLHRSDFPSHIRSIQNHTGRFQQDWQNLALHQESPLPENLPESHLEKKLKRRITKGLQNVDRTIDLHGMTQDQAYNVLVNAIKGCIQRGDKVLLIVTGKGGKRFSQTSSIPAAYRTRADFDQGNGVLKRMVPNWLSGNDLRPFVQSFDTASPEHGGDGALYVILRRQAKKSFTGDSNTAGRS